MGAQDERPTVNRHRLLQVIEALEDDALERAFGRLGQQGSELDEHQTKMLKRAAADPVAIGGGQVGKGRLDVRQCHAAPAGQHDVGAVAESSAQPGARAPGQSRDQGRQRQKYPGGQADRRRRSFRISITIGITDSTITMPTTR